MRFLRTPGLSCWKGYSVKWTFIPTSVAALLYKTDDSKGMVHAGVLGDKQGSSKISANQCFLKLIVFN